MPLSSTCQYLELTKLYRRYGMEASAAQSTEASAAQSAEASAVQSADAAQSIEAIASVL